MHIYANEYYNRPINGLSISELATISKKKLNITTWRLQQVNNLFITSHTTVFITSNIR